MSGVVRIDLNQLKGMQVSANGEGDCSCDCRHVCRVFLRNGVVYDTKIRGDNIAFAIQRIGVEKFRVMNGEVCDEECDRKALAVHFREEKFQRK